MEVIIPTHHSFDFDSARSSPHVSPPSTPKPFGGNSYYFSAPTSPSHLSQVIYDHRNFHDDEEAVDNGGSIDESNNQGSDDFAFDVAGEEWESSSVSAEDLFQGGVIKPLNNHRPIYIDSSKSVRNPLANTEMRAGRERQPSQRSAAAPRSARSLSPARKSRPTHQESSVCSVLTNVKGGAGGSSSKKWSFKDLFLFRSASEGRASDKDPLKKYTEAVLRSTGSRRRGGPAPPVSPHERHYTVNRAVSEDMKKKTFLPYKQGILGRLAFNPAVHALANGFGFSRK